MSIKKAGELPARLARVRGRFERWRRRREVGSRIPEALWTAAVKMAGAYGVNRTAKTLRVNYYALKKRVERQAVAAECANADGAKATFLELAPFEPAKTLAAHQLHVLLSAGNPDRAQAAAAWRPVGPIA